MKVVSIILIIMMCNGAVAETCPPYNSIDWEIKNISMDCENGTSYHCRENRKQRIEFCHRILVCPPGFFATLHQTEPSPILKCVPCPSERFDVQESISNVKSECLFTRQTCDISDHKIRWKQGNTTADDMCYCDYKAGYEMDADWYEIIPQTSIKICSGTTRCECRKTLRCSALPQKHLCILPNMTCEGQCPPGYTRPDFSFECKKKESPNVNNSTADLQDLPPTQLSTPTPKATQIFSFPLSPGNVQTTSEYAGETTNNATSYINSTPLVIGVSVCSALVIIVMVAVCLRKKYHLTLRKGKGRGDATRPLENLQAESQPMVYAETDTTNKVDDLNLHMRDETVS